MKWLKRLTGTGMGWILEVTWDVVVFPRQQSCLVVSAPLCYIYRLPSWANCSTGRVTKQASQNPPAPFLAEIPRPSPPCQGRWRPMQAVTQRAHLCQQAYSLPYQAPHQHQEEGGTMYPPPHWLTRQYAAGLLVYSVTYASCHCCRAIQSSDVRFIAHVSCLWSV
jgi:hypothetical protein